MHVSLLQRRLQHHLADKDPLWREDASGSWTATWRGADETARLLVLPAGPLTGAMLVDALFLARREASTLLMAHGEDVTDVARAAAARFGIPLLDASALPEPPVAAPPAPEAPAPPPAVDKAVEVPRPALAHEAAPLAWDVVLPPTPVVVAPPEPEPAIAPVPAPSAPPAVRPAPPLNVPTTLPFEARVAAGRFPLPDEGFFDTLDALLLAPPAPFAPEPIPVAAPEPVLLLPPREPLLLLPAHVEPEMPLEVALPLVAAIEADVAEAMDAIAAEPSIHPLLQEAPVALAPALVAHDVGPMFAAMEATLAEAEVEAALAGLEAAYAQAITPAPRPAAPPVDLAPAFGFLARAHADALAGALAAAREVEALALASPLFARLDETLHEQVAQPAPHLDVSPALPWDLAERAPVGGAPPAAAVEPDEAAAMPWNREPLFAAPGLAPADADDGADVELLPSAPTVRRETRDHPTLLPLGPTWGLPWPRPVAPTGGLSVADPALWAARERIQAVRDDLEMRGGGSFGAVKPEGSAWLKRLQHFGAP